jgi:phosphate-selective porin
MYARLFVLLALGSFGSRPLVAQYPPPAAPSTIRISGYLQAREAYQAGIGVTSTINRARLTATGTVATGVTYRLQGEFRTGNVGTGRASVSLTDAYIRYTRGRAGVQAGQFKTPFTREYWTSITDIETADRSTVTDSLAPKRDIGIMADYALGGRGTIWLGAFNGEGQNVTVNRDSSLLGVGRAVVRPLPWLALGANAARYFGDSTRYGADANVELPWVVLRGEWVGQHKDRAVADDKGWYALASLPLTPVIQPVVKYEWFNRPLVAALAQKQRAWTVGVNAYPSGPSTRLVLEYISRTVGQPGVRTGMALAQAQVRF